MVDKVTGDITNFTAVKQVGVTLHNFPKVLQTKLADIDDNINIASKSGKRLGAQVIGVDNIDTPTTARLFVAAGSDTNSPWVFVIDVVGTLGATVTPA